MLEAVFDLLKVYAELGAAALFLVLLLVVSVILYKTLTKGQKSEIERCVRMATLAERVVESMDSQSEILNQLRISIDADRSATEKLHAWLQGDRHRGGRG